MLCVLVCLDVDRSISTMQVEGSPQPKRFCKSPVKANCRHLLMNPSVTEQIHLYSTSSTKQSIFSALNIPLELTQCQLEDGYLLPRDVHDTLVTDLIGENNFKVAVMVRGILEKNKSLWKEHDVCVSANKGKYPLTHTSMLEYVSLWHWPTLTKCLTSLLSIASAKDTSGSIPVGVHLYLQYTLHCIKRDIDMLPKLVDGIRSSVERKLSWSHCAYPLGVAAELLAVTLDVESRGDSLWKEDLYGIIPIRDVLLSLFSAMYGVECIPCSEVPLLLVRVVLDHLGSFHAQQLFFRSLPSNPLKELIIDIMLDTKFSLHRSVNETPSELPSLNKTLTVHFAKLPDPAAGGLWSDCGYFLMLLSYILQCNMMTLETVCENDRARSAIRSALQRLTEQLSEDARLFSQLTKPVCWFYLQFVTSLTF